MNTPRTFKSLSTTHKYTWVILVVIAFIIVVCLGMVTFRHSKELAEKESAIQKNRERLLALNPQLKEEDLVLAQAHLEKWTEERLERSRAFFQQRFKAFGDREPAALLFEVKAFVERMRRVANKKGVSVEQGQSFGFDALVYEGVPPHASEVETLWGQKQILGNLLEILFQSHPQALLSVECQGVTHLFEDRQQSFPSLAQEVDAYQFKIEFEGHTQSLRRFLNYLEDTAFPITIRNIEVRPSVSAKDLKNLKKVKRQKNNIISSSPSIFEVTLEWSQFFEDIDEEALEQALDLSLHPSNAATSHVWHDPQPQRLEAGWVYDLFTPPDITLSSGADQFVATIPWVNSLQELDQPDSCPNEPLYRLQFLGYSEGEEPLLWIFDEESKTLLKGQVGQVFEEEGFTIHAFVPMHFSAEQDCFIGAAIEVWDERDTRQISLASYSPSLRDFE